VTIFAIRKDAGQTYIAMEHIAGVSFHQILASGAPAGWNNVINVIDLAPHWTTRRRTASCIAISSLPIYW